MSLKTPIDCPSGSLLKKLVTTLPPKLAQRRRFLGCRNVAWVLNAGGKALEVANAISYTER